MTARGWEEGGKEKDSGFSFGGEETWKNSLRCHERLPESGGKSIESRGEETGHLSYVA